MDYEPEYNMPIGMTPHRRTEDQRDPAKVRPALSSGFLAAQLLTGLQLAAMHTACWYPWRGRQTLALQ